MKWNGLPLLIFGSEGISKETYYLVKQINNSTGQNVYDFWGFVEDESVKIGKNIIDGYGVVTSDDEVLDYTKQFFNIGMIIPMGSPKIKSTIYNKIRNIENAVYPNLIHPSVKFDPENVNLGVGNILAAGINITCNVKIGNFNMINLNSTIGHDTKIGDFNVVNPLTAISGNVTIADLCLIGTGAKLLQGLKIGNNVTIGAGAVVVKDVDENSTVVGIPAKPMKENEEIKDLT